MTILDDYYTKWLNSEPDVLINAANNLHSYDYSEQKAIVVAMEKRSLSKNGLSDDDLKNAYTCFDPYQTVANNRQADLITEMERRNISYETITLEGFWQKTDENRLIESYRQLNQYDIISQEIISAEIKRRGLEAKAAKYKASQEMESTKVNLEGLGNISFGSILSFAWKCVWAFFIASIPLAIIWFICLQIITEASKPSRPSYYGY